MKDAVREIRVTPTLIALALIVAAFSVAGGFESSVISSQDGETPEQGYEVSGVLINGDGNAVPGVLITLSGDDGKQSTVSGGDGAFSFTSVTPGTYSLVFKVKGKKKAKREITVSNSDVDLGKISLD
jgi:hypothetical protein